MIREGTMRWRPNYIPKSTSMIREGTMPWRPNYIPKSTLMIREGAMRWRPNYIPKSTVGLWRVGALMSGALGSGCPARWGPVQVHDITPPLKVARSESGRKGRQGLRVDEGRGRGTQPKGRGKKDCQGEAIRARTVDSQGNRPSTPGGCASSVSRG